MGFHRKGNKTFWIDVYAHMEDSPIKGNCSAIDPETDLATENMIREQLESGNEWAWCCVQVEVIDMDSDPEKTESEYLGGCSYKSKTDFIKNSGYYNDMVSECLNRLT